MQRISASHVVRAAILVVGLPLLAPVSPAAAQNRRQAARPLIRSNAAASAADAAAAAQDPLRRGLSDVARNISALLKGQREESVAVGQFTGPPNFPTSGGPGIVKALTDELGRAGVDVKLRANLGVSGTYRVLSEKQGLSLQGAGQGVVIPGFDFEVTQLALKIHVEDATGRRLVEYDQKINDPATISKIFGLTFDSPPANPIKPIKESIQQPKVHIDVSRIRPAATSPFGIEILVRPAGGKDLEPREARIEDGLAFVGIERDEVYAVRLINDSPLEMAVALSIDGLSRFAFSEFKTARFVVVPPKSTVDVLGWHRNLSEVNEFVITEYAKGAVAMLGADPASIGTINATFHACWPKGGPPPADEPGQGGGGGIAGIATAQNSTGLGNRRRSNSQQLELDAGVVRASISVRYTK